MEVLYQSEVRLNPALEPGAEAFLPEGYVSGEDLFSPEEFPQEGAQEARGGARKLVFTARVDHQDVQAEIDEAQLPDLYQKARVTERVQARLAVQSETVEKAERLAKRLGFSGAQEMLSAAEEDYRERSIRELTDKGTPREVAESYVNQTAQEGPKAEQAGGRDFLAELRQLVEERPELESGQIPDEVSQRALASGKSLPLAFVEYERDRAMAEARSAREENRIMKQNQLAAARAPVKGAAQGGAVDTGPRDPFLAGFDDDRW